MIRTCVTSLLLATALSACSDPVSPPVASGLYGWSGVQEVTLPAGDRLLIVADTIEFRSASSAVRRTYRQVLPTDPAALEVDETEYSYVVRGNSVGLMPLCPLGEYCSGEWTYSWFDFIDFNKRSMSARDYNQKRFVWAGGLPPS
jgi:hypothetical protein